MASRFLFYGPDKEVDEPFPFMFAYNNGDFPTEGGMYQMPKELYEEVYDWCINQFSGFPDRWLVKHRSVFMIARSADAMMFRLRWC